MQSKIKSIVKESVASIPSTLDRNSTLWSSIAANGKGKSEAEVKIVRAIAAVSKKSERKDRSVVIMGLPVSTHTESEQQRIDDRTHVENMLNIFKVEKSLIKRVPRFKTKLVTDLVDLP
jgi:hypothetical protein